MKQEICEVFVFKYEILQIQSNATTAQCVIPVLWPLAP